MKWTDSLVSHMAIHNVHRPTVRKTIPIMKVTRIDKEEIDFLF